MSIALSDRHYLTALFEPASVAIIGATERIGSVGSVLIDNMLAARYAGALYAVNPKYRQVRGVPCHASVRKLPQRVDLAVIATPAATVPGVIEECGKAGVRAACVITAGFSEAGPAGEKLERELVEHARRHQLRVLGPNCFGLQRPSLGVNATFGGGAGIAGSLGMVSQSGALCAAMLDWARPNGIGFSSVVSLGGSSDIDFGEVIDYLVDDSRTEHILLYVEGVRDARRFVSALRAAARVKPVILMKSGRHPASTRAAVSHTGAIVGADDVFDAVVRRAGVVRVRTIGQMVAAAHALARRVKPRGERLAIVTNGGGPGVMAADHAAELGIPLAELSPATSAILQRSLPPNWSHGNPVDLIGDAGPERYGAAIAACLADEQVDGVLAVLSPQGMTTPLASAHAVIEAAKGSSKPLLTSWMGEEQVASSRRLFMDAGIPTFRTPEPAVEMFAHVSAFYRNQRLLMQTPGPLADATPPDLPGARAIIDGALAARRSLLSEMEAKTLLAAFHIPVVPARVARDANEAARIAEEIGWPVALKICSPDLVRKSEVGGVRQGLRDAQALRAAWGDLLSAVTRERPQARLDGVIVEPMLDRPHARELMVGMLCDPVFGPALVFGAGGAAIEVQRDRAVALPPLNGFLVSDMIRNTRVARMLGAYRQLPPADLKALETVLQRVSEMVCELPQLVGLDINPLLLDEHGALAADARILIAAAPTSERYAHMAIHPYPVQWVSSWTAADGTRVQLRPVRPEDAELEQQFVKGLSAESRHFRFMNTLRELTPAMLVRFTQIDYDREMAFVATIEREGRETEIAVCRYVTNPDGETCEFALVVADAWHRHGLGRRMMNALIEAARTRGLKAMIGHVLAENAPMLGLCAKLGFAISESREGPTVRHVNLRLAQGA